MGILSLHPVGSLDTSEGLFPLRKDKELLILGSGILINATSYLIPEDNRRTPLLPLDQSSVNSFDRRTLAPFNPPLDTLSTGMALSALMSPAVLLTTSVQEWLSIGTMYTEALLLTWGIKELGKNLFPRFRPYTYFPGAPEEDLKEGDFQRAFPSGHTALAFTAASFNTYVFNSYYPESPWGLTVGLISYSLAGGTGALRIASGNHHLSDVLTGAALGTLSGILVPWLHRSSPFSWEETDGGLSLSLTMEGFFIRHNY